ncbi:GumC family protein [Methylotenera versatilis]|uniref:GumC family protein n=1 Tax=Methylotenera versatilis TaxID=1055487 RepID=UPI0006476522|nr:Wzz/FepE/Etk N-terminal domain-containing protein [Methylotenera versatilis]
MANEYELTLSDYLSIFKRRWLQMLVAFLLILSVAVATAVFLPPTYQSTGTILIESQQIPDDVVKATVTSYADERIEVIKQRVMTRDNLYRIIQKYNLYPKKIDSATISTLIDDMRKSISVILLNADVERSGGGRATIAFKVGFEYERPEVAHKVANEIVTLFLDENVKARTERATETTEFLTQEVENLRKELEGVENKVAAFKQEHSNSLPEHMEMHMSLLQRSESDIKEVDRDYKSTQEELRYLDVELASAKANVKTNASGEVIGTTSELEKAKAELERSLGLYKETHPTVRALKRKIEALENPTETKVDAKPARGDIATELVIAKVQAQIEAAKARLNSLAQQRRSLEARVDQLQNQVSQSPQVERGLFTLMRDYENAKSKYEEVKSKQINAKIAENLEQENKAERFSMLEPPFFPDKPMKPNRKKIIALGLFAGLAGALALAALLEALDRRVRGVESLTSLINMRPLVIIPYISTNAELKRRKNFNKYMLISILALIGISLLVIHFVVMPLDLLTVKLMARFA